MEEIVLKKPMISLMAATALAVVFSSSADAQSRDQIRIVGSSTVFPFSTAVAEEFGRSTRYKTPIVESTGSGGGLKLFCAGVGVGHPDITNASRRIKASEVKLCASNGVTEIVEVKIGYDGIVLANSRASGRLDISLHDLWLALAAEVLVNGELVANPYKTWRDVNAALPKVKIEVLGPPPTSGTRDAFVELAMEGGCKTFPEIKAMKAKDKNAYKKICHSIREDGAYVEAGENDNLIVQKLQANKDAFGVFGYSFLDQNSDILQGSKIKGVDPTFEAIADSSYPVSRSLYFYVKKAHIGAIPGIEAYLAEFASDGAWGDYGYLTDKGLIPMPTEEREKYADDVAKLKNLDLDGS